MASNRTYFVNSGVDYACMGGLSLVALVVSAAVFGTTLNATATVWAVYLSWVINWPHFSATSYRLFRRKENWNEYPLTAFAVPLLMVLGVAACFADPQRVAPYFVKIFLLWSPYHFSGQNLGLTLVYARRSGCSFASWERRAFSLFIFSSFLAPSLSAEVGEAVRDYYGIAYPTLFLPGWVATLSWYFLYATTTMVVLVIVRRWVLRRRIPEIVLLPGFSQLGWFVLGASTPTFYYFVPLFHSLQYLLIAWAMQLGERQRELSTVRSGFTWRETSKWLGINLAGGAALFWGLPHLAARQGIPLPLATGVFIAAIQIHHFIVDGVIWKLRNPRVASPLLTRLSDFQEAKKAA